MTAGEPVLDELGSVLRIIILLENEATTKRIACVWTHGVLEDVFILKLIHDSLNPPPGTHAKARDGSPNHDISTPLLHCWNLVLGVETSALWTTNPLYPIRTKQHVFALITPKGIFPLFLGPVLVRLRPFHTRLAILRRDHWFLDGASSIQSSCSKPTPDSTNRGFWGHKDRAQYLQPSETIPPPRSTGNVSSCGGTVSGVGGIIASPGFPYYFPKDVDCIWLIRVDYHMKIYIRLLKMQLYGSIANCAEAELTLYDGYSSISFNPKVLQKYCGDLRYYKNVEEQTQLSSRNRLLLRFKTSAAQVMKGEDLDKNAVGFKIVWTAVDFKKEGQCQEFICKESRYCFSSPENACAEMKNYCIDKSLVCNGHPNCGNEDYTDEDKCNIPLLAGCGAAGGVLLLSFLIGFCLYRRHGSLSNSHSQSLNMQLRQLEHSPSYSGRPPSSNFYYPGDPNCSIHAASYELLHTKPMARVEKRVMR
ncbi:hypothetical protein AVEN_246603-1 [Araneus ventricosus]|uniref:CUB domain-containing protein n=1 Tax=Araneus ventricosus TaxID=182803 RepID=A0A4Y2DCE7_ARAVE|nr:hypothetical protein AVEN_246603-1 [Araneus ventricosus]